MTVYVDDAAIQARVPYAGQEIVGTWFHLTADTQEELHEFARHLKLSRSWFQDARTRGGVEISKTSRGAQNWHYDITASIRRKALALGARPVTQEQLKKIVDERYAKLYPRQAEELGRRTREVFADFLDKHPSAPHNLPITRTEAGYPNCSTCDGGGCPDCTDPA